MVDTVLVVEDEREIRDLVRRYLERAGLVARTTASGAEAIRLLGEGGVDVMVLDLGLPDVDGMDVLAAAREGAGVPAVVLTARSSVDERIAGLRQGADDYVTKPFSPTELVLRVQAVLHRTRAGVGPGGGNGAVGGGPVSFAGGRLRIDEARHEATVDGRVLELTPTEWGLLTTLASVPGRVFSRYELVNRVRGYEFAGYERSIDSHIKNLRHKLGTGAGEVIGTVLGVGYRMVASRDP